MTEFFQTVVSSLLMWVGLVFWIAIKSELIPDIKQMSWKCRQKWFWILIIISFYIAILILLLYVWLSPGFILTTK